MIIPNFSKSLEKQVLTKEPREVQEKQMQGCASGTKEAGALLAVQQLCRKAPKGPGGNKLKASQLCALALVKANPTLGCVSLSIALKRLRKVTVLCSSIFETHLE